jgi:hypothetical protein
MKRARRCEQLEEGQCWKSADLVRIRDGILRRPFINLVQDFWVDLPFFFEHGLEDSIKNSASITTTTPMRRV